MPCNPDYLNLIHGTHILKKKLDAVLLCAVLVLVFLLRERRQRQKQQEVLMCSRGAETERDPTSKATSSGHMHIHERVGREGGGRLLM